ncbi:hypothetical protein N7468_008115 [Penicillium chermesinum]|uniref:Uncharacterized protein n=1 Tax=Penicillium chermesinum TaxID=63820 RepID=A0A9W9NPK8_9EURO|nr:uncharacterized protein N7468_008115 [Penicillium chermesinum]KAJ5223573.1 hypothetical protein N7468_008115 [Penicillium chermesinum]
MAPSNDSPRPRFYRSAPRDTSSYGVSQGEYAERFNTTRPSPYYENPAGPPQGFSYRSHYAPMSPPVREANTFARPFYEIPDYYHPDASANFQRASAFSTGHYYGEPSFHKEEAGDNPFQHARTSSNPFYAQPDYYHPAATANLRQASAFSTDNYYGQPSFYYQGANANPFQQNNVTSNPSYGRPILHHREDNDQRQGGSQLIRRFPQASNANSWEQDRKGGGHTAAHQIRSQSELPRKKPSLLSINRPVPLRPTKPVLVQFTAQFKLILDTQSPARRHGRVLRMTDTQMRRTASP